MKYTQVGLAKERLDPEYTESRVAKWISKGKVIDENTEMRKQLPVTDGMFLILEYYFLDEMKKCYQSMSQILTCAEDYFFGSWREQVPTGNQNDGAPSGEYQNINCPWEIEFSSCMVWCACLDDWSRAKKIAVYLRDNICLDIDQKPENRAWLLYLGGILMDRSRSELADYATCIESGKRKREKILLILMQTILHGTEAEIKRAAKHYFDYYKANEARSQKLTDKVAMDGTFLVHFAKHLGTKIPVPEDMAVHIIPQAPPVASAIQAG